MPSRVLFSSQLGVTTAFIAAPLLSAYPHRLRARKRSRQLRFGAYTLRAQLSSSPFGAFPPQQQVRDVSAPISPPCEDTSSDWSVPRGTTETLFVLDAFGLLYRSYHALVKTTMSSRGMFDTRAVYGFTTVMLSFLSKHARGSPVVVVFEGRRLAGQADFRTQLYPEYKAGRGPTPTGVIEAVPWAKRMCAVMGLAVVEVDLYEADDTIGAVVRKARRAGVKSVIVSLDKDFRQLLAEGSVEILKPSGSGVFEEVTESSFRREFANLHPRQYVDVLTLIGDKADGLKGVPGIGKLTAPRLIAHYGKLEFLLGAVRSYFEKECSGNVPKDSKVTGAREKSTAIEGLPMLTKRTARSLRDNEQHALLVKRLITIREDVSLGDVTWQSIQRKPVNVSEANEILRVLEFTNRNTASKILHSADDVLHLRSNYARKSASTMPKAQGKNANSNSVTADADAVGKQKTRANILTWPGSDARHPQRSESDVNYLLSPSDAEIECYLSAAAKRIGIMGVVSRHEGGAELGGMAVSVKSETAIYIDLSHGRSLCRPLLEVLENRHVEKRGWFLKSLYKSLTTSFGIKVRGKLFDNRIASELLHAGERLTDGRLASLYLGDGALDTWIGGRDHRLSSSYTAQDSLQLCDVALRLSDRLSEEISKANLTYVFDSVELPLVPVLGDMEISGVPINSDGLRAFEERVRKRMQKVEFRLKDVVSRSVEPGKEFRPSSRDDVANLIFDTWQLNMNVRKTSSGKFSVNKRVLTSLAEDDMVEEEQRLFAQLMLEYREASKILSTYTKSLLSAVHADGRIRTTFVQESAASGRLSTSNPNLQSIPIRSVLGREVRSMVQAPDGCSILCADYSQIELRIIASLSGDESLKSAFRKGTDVHRSVAARIFGVANLNDVTDEQRRKAKEVNYGIPYGISSYGLGQQLGIPGREAKRLMSQFHEEFPKVKRLMENLIDSATSSGYAKTMLGRRLPLPLLLHGGAEERNAASRVAVNMPVQGTQADMIKLAMIRIAKRLGDAKARSRLIMQLHDELLVEVADSEVDAVKSVVEEEMASAFPLSGVDVVVNTGCGKSWLDAAHS